jgi:outer membrane protein OmpA-like peptidoglycan-associated protein/Tfp pilus assembly protein PilF
MKVFCKSKYLLKSFSFLVVILLISCQTTAQIERPLNSKNKKAIKFFEIGKEQYQTRQDKEAMINIEKALDLDPNFTDALIVRAYIYVDRKEYEKAIADFEKVVKIEPTIGSNVYFTLGKLNLLLGEYNESLKYFDAFLKIPNRNEKMKNEAMANITNCKFALNAIKNPVNFDPKNLGQNVNSSQDEYYPALTADEKTLLFTRNRLDPNSPMNGLQEDFYISKYDDKTNTWGEAVNIGGPINTPSNEGAPTLSADGQVLIFTACDLYGSYGKDRSGLGSCDIFYSRKKGNSWSKPINLGNVINTRSWDSQPSFSSDGRTLYFVSNRSGGFGESDIWVSSIGDDGVWSKVQNLGPNINTPFQEESVFIHPDNQTLYFASSGHVGMGGLDIYVSRKQADGTWGKAQNLGYPINTFKDENSLLVGASGKIAYFSSNREGGFGGLDIYSFELDKELRPQEVTYMKGKVFDKETNEPLEAAFELIDLSDGKVVIESYSNAATGEFLVSLPAGKNYALNASKSKYLFYSDNFSMKENSDKLSPTIKNVPLQPIKVGEAVVLKNVFFETASSSLKEESKIELDKLAELLKANPKMKIELGGHTDNVGNPKSNQLLSEKRGQSVFDYLVSKGVANTRLTFKGFGDEKPIADNTTEEGKAQNRRTEFKIISIE